ncbi:MAG: hydroxylamine reductase [Promethearchaeota archaeon]
MDMFCYQCQETSKNQGCTIRGICGKAPQTNNIQQAALYLVRGISFWSTKARQLGITDGDVNVYIAKILFSTITNANFDDSWFLKKIEEGFGLKERIKRAFLEEYKKREGKDFDGDLPDAANWSLDDPIGSGDQVAKVGKDNDPLSIEDEDIRSLKELILYSLKGMAAYMDHAHALGYEDDEIWGFMQETLAAFLDTSKTVDDFLKLVDETGKVGLKALKLLDDANTNTFGNPEPTKVSIGVRPGPGILISGHDLLDLYELLKQTEGTGINIYTHGEMLPANAYPKLKDFKHLAGNYGGAWWKQKKEFESFNGPILLTTNCLVPPKDSYFDRLFVTGNVGYPEAKVIVDREPGKSKDFSEIINLAKKLNGPSEIEKGEITIGFARNSLQTSLDSIMAAIKAGKIKRFIVMAGCDGRHKERKYYTEVASKLPPDTVILTAGCAKYRYNKLDLGEIDGIPRVIDAGQCNDSYSLVLTALAIAKEVGEKDVNNLPISFDISWYEQKAVLILVVLLHLGIKDIRLGPTLPAFLSPNVVKIIVDNWALKPITEPEKDIESMMNGQ